MKKLTLLFLATLFLNSCSSNEDETAKNTTITINFNHNWDGVEVTKADFNNINLINANGDKLSIERLRYLISDIYVESENDIITNITDYILIDVGEEENLTFSTETLLLNGTYNLYMRFGFSDDDNYAEGGYTDLNSAIFNVGDPLGGGYHYMQFDGKFINSEKVETGFNFHAIRATNAVEKTADEELQETDTSFEINFGEIEVVNNKANINIEVDLSQWFEDPNTWDLNALHQMLMPNYSAQIMMNENGKTVFSLAEEEEEE